MVSFAALRDNVTEYRMDMKTEVVKYLHYLLGV
jgi:hypothetical protein